MKIIFDDEYRSRVLLFSSAGQMAESARRYGQDPTWNDRSFVGRDFGTWGDLEQAVKDHWAEGLEAVNGMLAELRKCEIASPKTVRRVRRRSDCDGEMDLDRAMRGDADYMDTRVRQKTHGSENVAVLCNVGGACRYHWKDLLWRGAAAVAAVDVLEAAGYSSEIWMWWRSKEVYKGDHPNAFIALKLKEAGNPLDLDEVTKCLSGWFFRVCVLGAAICAGPAYAHVGTPVYDDSLCGKYLDVTEGIKKVMMEAVFDRDDAVAAARKLINQVTSEE